MVKCGNELAPEDGRRWKRIQDDHVTLSNSEHLLNSPKYTMTIFCNYILPDIMSAQGLLCIGKLGRPDRFLLDLITLFKRINDAQNVRV